MLRKGCGRLAVDNSCSEVCVSPPLTSCSKKESFLEQKKRTIHLLQNRTILFVLDMGGAAFYSGDIHDKFCQGENGDFPLTSRIDGLPGGFLSQFAVT